MKQVKPSWRKFGIGVHIVTGVAWIVLSINNPYKPARWVNPIIGMIYIGVAGINLLYFGKTKERNYGHTQKASGHKAENID